MPKKKSLVIVESPAKARTISRILGSDYDVKASVGHVRDLPKSKLGIRVNDDFEPDYVVPREKSKTVKDIKDAARKAGQVYLASDPDREGEAIAWHLTEAASLRDLPMHRVVFHEITPDAVREAFKHPRDIDMKLVDAQQARRVVDRLMGYPLSGFVSQKVRRGLSAGRVQSVAVRLVVEREREIRGFVPQEYWTIETELEKQAVPPAFRAKLAGFPGKKQKIEITNGADADRFVRDLRSSGYRVSNTQTKTQARRPAAPFITSTLQQEAARRLGFTAKRTMAVAQQLYEGISIGSEGETGLITYMRTDSTNIAPSAQQEAREFIGRKYSADFVPPSARDYKRKVKGAQEAHEAIRPTSVMREPDSLRSALKQEQLRLYTLIWQRFVASQMADAQLDVTSVDIEATPTTGSDPLLLRASNTQLRFAGFRQVYVEAHDEGDQEEDMGTNPLPALSDGDPLNLLQVLPEQHFTEPPPRYTEASLVKALEEKGIGRPSTYAPTMSTIQDRDYVEKDGRALKPTELGETVNDLLVEYFPLFVDENFTAGMEVDLDEVASGERSWQPVVKDFYEPLEKALARAKEEAPKQVQETGEMCPDPQGIHDEPAPLLIRWGRRGQFIGCSGYPECKYTRPLEGETEDALPEIQEQCPDCGKPLAARTSRRGPFIGCTGYPECRYTRPIEGEDGASATTQPPQETDEKCPKCDSAMVVRSGRFGPFLACSTYPKCKGAKPLPTGAKCPQDGGDLVEKRFKGRTFYGCANYPECKFTLKDRPLVEPCPQCGGLITAERDGDAKCTACDWRGEVPATRTPEPAVVG